MSRVGILISGSGSNMVALLDSMAVEGHPGTPAIVVSNRADADGLAKAAERGVATAVVDHKGRSREDFDAELAQTLNAAGVELLCTAGFMRILTDDFVRSWAGRMINIHPSLLPLFKGLNTHARALEAGMAVHGCTVHRVTPELDSGPILGQAVVPVEDGDTPDTLAARVLKLEHQLYPLVLRRVIEGREGKVALLG